MQRKLTIMIDEAVDEGLYRKVVPRKIARFIEEIVRLHVVGRWPDHVRERGVEEWSEVFSTCWISSA